MGLSIQERVGELFPSVVLEVEPLVPSEVEEQALVLLSSSAWLFSSWPFV